ncbi:hypothetical protein ACJRO7_029552 [Eucalyptus globulus]|uniref:RRM domain-containing protein n=1 Tax=Eucalyptus globulus TaxID=34317 RepID=A0ABD3J8X7_EUCGL
MSRNSSSRLNSVFYAELYHPIQAGSIDGTDVLPHDNAVYRAHLCSSAGLYDPFGDPKAVGDPYCTLFVGRLSHFTSEDTLRKALSKYGHVKNLRLVRHIVTGASRRYAFVEYETEREMRRAYKAFIVDSSLTLCHAASYELFRSNYECIWIQNEGGRKTCKIKIKICIENSFESFFMRRPIPLDDLKRLGIPPPPEGRYMSPFEVPSPPRRGQGLLDKEEGSHGSSSNREEHTHRRNSEDREDCVHGRSPVPKEGHRHDKRCHQDQEFSNRKSSLELEEKHHYRSSGSRKRSSTDDDGRIKKRSRRSSSEREDHKERDSSDREERHHKSRSRDEKERSYKRHKHRERSHQYEGKRSISQEYPSDY